MEHHSTALHLNAVVKTTEEEIKIKAKIWLMEEGSNLHLDKGLLLPHTE